MRLVRLDALMDYAKCPMQYWWRHRARLVAPPTMEALPYVALQMALAAYYRGDERRLVDCVMARWEGWLQQWRCPVEALAVLQRYGQAEHGILELFARGEITRKDGSLYTEPRMTRRYAELYEERGLKGLKDGLQRMTRGVPIPSRTGYDLVTAFSDSILWASRYGGPPRESGSVLGGYEFRVPVADRVAVVGHAAVVMLECDRVVHAEMHDYEYDAARETTVSRHLMMVALANAVGPEWEGDPQLVYRHVPSGWSMVLDWTEPATRLLPVLTAAVRGVECGVFLPRMAAAERLCTHCAYLGMCVTEEGLDVLDDLDATALDVARRVPAGLQGPGLTLGQELRDAEGAGGEAAPGLD